MAIVYFVHRNNSGSLGNYHIAGIVRENKVRTGAGDPRKLGRSQGDCVAREQVWYCNNGPQPARCDQSCLKYYFERELDAETGCYFRITEYLLQHTILSSTEFLHMYGECFTINERLS